jgi:hypothetical protein
VARRLNPRRVTLGGHEAVALTPKEYEQLVASRRQIGGQSARVRVLAQEAKRTEQLLQDLEALITAPGSGCRDQAGAAGEPCPLSAPGSALGSEDSGHDADGSCLRCSIAALLSRHRSRAA